MKKLLALFLTISSVSAMADVDNWTTIYGDPWRNSTGQCWRNSSWSPATAHPDCDGALTKPTPRVQVTIPAPKVEVPVTPPAPKPSIPAVVKLTFATDTLFDFDKSVLKLEGRQMLDGMIGKINHDYNEDYIIIAVGHTDWIGTDDYNMKLGMRRAQAVRAYLVSKGVEPKRVYVDSKGERQPIADNKTAQGRAKNRRVEIEVFGTQR
jgi:OOP family OmpA-OmpF porin